MPLSCFRKIRDLQYELVEPQKILLAIHKSENRATMNISAFPKDLFGISPDAFKLTAVEMKYRIMLLIN